MIDMNPTIVAKSDQLNADDLIGGDKVITITDVRQGSTVEQPVKIFYEGGQPWLPCKTMRRVLVSAWGPDAAQYIGRSLQLYRDPSVKWAGKDVGGIRIRAMSDIKNPMVMALTVTRGAKKPFQVNVLAQSPSLASLAEEAARGGLATYQQFFERLNKSEKQSLLNRHEEFKKIAAGADAKPAPIEEEFATENQSPSYQTMKDKLLAVETADEARELINHSLTKKMTPKEREIFQEEIEAICTTFDSVMSA
jgi:hypothetical protein